MQSGTASKKLFITGLQSSGKTCIHLVIFGTHPIKPTSGIINPHDKFMGELDVCVWDSDTRSDGSFFNNLESLKGIEVLVYVFDVYGCQKKDLRNLQICIERCRELNENLSVVILLHKMDRFPADEKEKVFDQTRQEIGKVVESLSFNNIKGIYATSVWDNTLYKAWSEIVQMLTVDLESKKGSLKQIASACDCDEVVLFDKKTLLMIGHYEKESRQEIEKYERVSTVIKQFKLNCKSGLDLTSVQARNSKFIAIIREFTDNTCIMVISFNAKLELQAIDLSLSGARKYFEKKSGNLIVA